MFIDLGKRYTLGEQNLDNAKTKMQISKPKHKMQNQYQNAKTDIKYRAFYLSINIVKYLDGLVYKISTKIIIDQLVRCSTSIGANVVEARGSSSKREFLNFF